MRPLRRCWFVIAAVVCVAPGGAAAQTAAADSADVASIAAIVKASYEAMSGPAGTPRQWRRDSSLYMPAATYVALRERDGREERPSAPIPAEWIGQWEDTGAER